MVADLDLLLMKSKICHFAKDCPTTTGSRSQSFYLSFQIVKIVNVLTLIWNHIP